jgi:hypothetical protein
LRKPTELRAELTDQQSRRLESFLADLAARREPAELLMQRELVYDEQSRRWHGRLTGAVRRLLGEDELENRAAILGALNRRDMLVGLLRTDLALRRFRRTHDRWPARLEELVPANSRRCLLILGRSNRSSTEPPQTDSGCTASDAMGSMTAAMSPDHSLITRISISTHGFEISRVASFARRRSLPEASR